MTIKQGLARVSLEEILVQEMYDASHRSHEELDFGLLCGFQGLRV